jgi:hypothetical protein
LTVESTLRNEIVGKRKTGFDRVSQDLVATALCRRAGNASTERGGYSKDGRMKKLGMILLAVYLILDGLLGFGLNMGAAIFLLYFVAILAGALILIGALKSSV